MATTILYPTMRKFTSLRVGDWLPFTTTTAPTAAATLISTQLARFRDDTFNDNYWGLVTGPSTADNLSAARQISDFTQSTGTLTAYGANFVAEDPSIQVTAELHKVGNVNFDAYAQALNDARLLAYTYLSLPVLTPNPHFEVWTSSSYPDYWRVYGSGLTAAKETSTIHQSQGAASCKVTRAGTDGYLYIAHSMGTSILPEDIRRRLRGLRGQRVTFAKWVYSSVASQARLQIYCGGDTASADTSVSVFSPYHSGGGSWEYLTASMEIPFYAGDIQLRCWSEGSNTACYFDGAGSIDGSFPDAVYLSSVSAETDRMELNDEQGMGLAWLAASLLASGQVGGVAAEDAGRMQAMAESLEQKAWRTIKGHRTDSVSFLPPLPWTAAFPRNY